jgi:hypothetical protein
MLKYEGFVKTIIDWAIIGGGRIIPGSIKTTGNKNCFQPRPIPSYLLKIVFQKFDP